ncbi:MAG: BamA/TamA family outer membrane protein [Paracoccaceae bacterium]|nr:BamA/TamA family outer membrane protein [Paracoccaceae bacterium]
MRLILRTIAMVAMAALAGCGENGGLEPVVFSQPETALSYEVALIGSPSDEVTALAEQSLSAYRFRDKGAASLAFLRRRGEGDIPVLLKILRSRGYYVANASARAEETGDGVAQLTITVEPGEAFTLTAHDLVIEQSGTVAPPALKAPEFGSPIGEQALAADIATAEAAAVEELKRRGFPYARFEGRKGLADPAAATLTVESRIVAGPSYVFGPITIEGLRQVDADYLLTYQPWEEGAIFATDALDEFQRRLFGTELFAAATVTVPKTPPEGAEPAPLPVTVEVEEGPRRRVAGGLRYDTDLGPTVRASFEHRNLFGANERLLIQGEAGLIEQTAGIGLRKPQFLRPGQDLLTDLTAERTTDDAFDALSLTGFLGLEREVSKRWTGGLGGLAEASYIEDAGAESEAYLFGVPVFAEYDGSNSLLNPTKGARARFEATPFFGTEDSEFSHFLVLDGTGSVYQPLDRDHRYVVAARGRFAAIPGPSLDAIPATRRLYSGGGGSVRGYEQDLVGPLDANRNPIGGRSALEAGLEFRAGLWGDVGGVVFAEAGSVSTAVWPDFEEGVQAAAGVGLRYFSPAGPIRLDLAFPVNGRGADDFFQFYFSIGQAF